MNIKDCFENGLLRKDIKDLVRARKSIEVAKHKLDIAQHTFDADIFEEALINSYAAMFHAARALLFRDGIVEKSHFGLYVYLKEKYSQKIEPRFLNELNNLRLERHELMYGLEKMQVSEADAVSIIKTAEQFIKSAEKLLHQLP
jgi:uncharacterized protein (UPF0332 family)